MILLIAANRLVTGFPSELSQVAARTLLKKLIKISFYPAVAEYDGKQVLRDGEVIPALHSSGRLAFG